LSVTALFLAVVFAEPLQPYTETLQDSLVKIDMAPVPAGEVEVGGKKVAVKPFWIATTETTWEAFDAFLLSGPPTPAYDTTEFAPDAIARPSKVYLLPDLGWGHKGYPAINLTYTSAQMFCRWLSSVTKKKYRLPTEAEWEWACRKGDAGPEGLEERVWHSGTAKRRTHPVAKFAADRLGLHDMHGNVGEWSTDAEGKPVLCGSTFQDPASASTPGHRKRWEASWQQDDPQLPKSRWWLSNGPFAGFRVVREP